MSCMRTVFVCGRTRCTALHRQLEHRVVRRPTHGDVEVQVDGEDVVDRLGRWLHRLHGGADRGDVLLRAHARGHPHAALLDPRARVVDLGERRRAGVGPEREVSAHRRREHVGIGVADERPARRAARRLHELGAARIFIVSRIVPRLTLYSSASSTSGGRRSPAASSPLRMLLADLVGDLLRSARRPDRTRLEACTGNGFHAAIVRRTGTMRMREPRPAVGAAWTECANV